MKLPLICFLIAALLSCQFGNDSSEETTPAHSNYKNGNLKWNGEWITRDTSNLNYPCTLDSTILIFFHTWEDTVISSFMEIPDTILARINQSTGMWLRNNYYLWNRTCLVEYFWEKGIIHPDDISAIILTSFHRYLNGKEIRLDEQVAMFKQFWKNEFDKVYRIEDSASWSFPPSMWDMGMTYYPLK